MASSPYRRPTRRGYTLLEMLIVVAVVLVVFSLSWPALSRPLEKSKLRDAARQLRAALARARIEAIQSGAAQQFCYQPGTGHFEVAARSTSEGGGGFTPVAFQGSGEGRSAASDLAYSEAAQNEAAQYELPEGVRFFDPLAPDAPPVEADPIASPGDQAWSTPIILYPNGRTFNARIRLYGEQDYYVDVTLRGLTGIATVGEVQRIEEPLEERLQAAPEESL